MGALLIGLGLILIGSTIRLFFQYGEGTLAPWTPTQHLVVRGIYCYVRNPMISGVCAVLLGEALVLGVVPLFYWFGFVVLLNLIYIPLVEEPGLAERFGAAYLRYQQHVPRWIRASGPGTTGTGVWLDNFFALAAVKALIAPASPAPHVSLFPLMPATPKPSGRVRIPRPLERWAGRM